MGTSLEKGIHSLPWLSRDSHMAPALVYTLFLLGFLRAIFEACQYVGTPPTFKVVPRTRLGQRRWQQTSADHLGKHLCAVRLAPCLPLVGWGAT